jgi:superfamily I DNA/RNA helicase
MKYTTAEKWVPADDFVLEDNALATVSSTANTLVIAGPGAGKTELLAQRACYLLETNHCRAPRKILAISFKRDAAENLAARVKLRTDENINHRFVSHTYDAFAKLLLDRFRYGLPKEYQPHKDYVIDTAQFPEQIMSAFELRLPGCSRGRDSRETRSIRTQLMDSISAADYPLNNQDTATEVLLEILNGPGQATLTFSIINRLVGYLLRSNPKIVSYLRQTYTHVFLDEFQDTTQRQYDVLKEIFLGGNTIITAVGDPKQRIMLWAGAKANIFAEFENDFGAERVPLVRNYRSTPRLIELQNILTANHLGSTVTCLPPPDTETEEDAATFYHFNNYQQEATEIAETIRQIIEGGEVDPRDVCLLYKQQPAHYGEVMIQALANLGINARVENEFQDLMTEPLVRFIVNLLQGSCDDSAKEAREKVIYEYFNFNNVVGDHPMLLEEIRIRNQLKQLKSLINAATTWPEIVAEINRLIDEITFAKFSAHYPQYNELSYFKECQQKCTDHIRDAYAASGDILTALNIFLGTESVPLMTVHKSKGLEFDTVFFIGFEDQTFWNFSRQPDEDTRAFFVALSRAKKQVNFTFCESRINNFQNTDQRVIRNIDPIFKTLINSNLVKQDDRRSR